MKLNKLRNKIAYFVATDKARKRFEEGVTDDNFYDFGCYVDLIAKSLRRLANDRASYTALNYRLPRDWVNKSTEELQVYADAETKLLNKWADILEISEDDLNLIPMFDPYFNALRDHLFGSKSKVPLSQEIHELGVTLDEWCRSLQNLKSDILAEIGEHYMYFWD